MEASSLRLVASSRMISPNAKMSVCVVKWGALVVPLAVAPPAQQWMPQAVCCRDVCCSRVTLG